MSIATEVAPSTPTVINQVAVGAYAPVFRSGDAYKSVGEVVSRTAYPDLSAAFPRNGSFTALARVLPLSQQWNAVASGNGVTVAVGGTSGTPTDKMAVSYDGGITWVTHVVAGLNAWFTDIIFAGGQFVAIEGFTSGNGNRAFTSPDGLTWTARTLPSASGWTAIAHNGSVYVAVMGGGTVCATSPDGITWTSRTIISGNWIGLAHGNGVFVAVGQTAGTCATSPDGITWTARTIGGGTAGKGIAFGSGIFVVVTANFVTTSTDGITWTQRITSASLLFTNLAAVRFGNGCFVVACTTSGLLTSADGIAWRGRSTPTADIYGAIGFCASSFVGIVNSAASTVAASIYVENLDTSTVPSDNLYLSGTAGQFIRVK